MEQRDKIFGGWKQYKRDNAFRNANGGSTGPYTGTGKVRRFENNTSIPQIVYDSGPGHDPYTLDPGQYFEESADGAVTVGTL